MKPKYLIVTCSLYFKLVISLSVFSVPNSISYSKNQIIKTLLDPEFKLKSHERSPIPHQDNQHISNGKEYYQVLDLHFLYI